MTTCEHLHQKFINISTAGLIILTILDDSFEENPSEFFHKVFNTYHKKIQETPENGKLHDAFRTLLCHEYQLKVKDTSHSTAQNFNENLLKNLMNNLLQPDANDENRAILDDVAILQIVLHLNLEDINKLFKETLELTTEQIIKGKNLQNYLPIVENLVNALCLRQKLKVDHEKSQELLNIIGLLPPAIRFWFLIINENITEEWRPFLSILLKLTSAFPNMFVHFSWILVTGYRTEFSGKESLTLLCGILDNLLSSSSESSVVSINLSFCFNEDILLLISTHLVSNVQSGRRRAQYVLKRIIDYSRESPHDLLYKYKNKSLNPPFIFSEDNNLNIQEIQRKYFLLLETLEVKQAALVLSEVNLLDGLLDARVCNELLIDITWIRCIFARLLNHDNTTVIKAGLITALRMEMQIFDDEFITLLTKSLNHTFLYDNQNSDPQPKILEELSEFFIRAENNEKNFMSKFVLSASKVNWSPIPLFYVLEALGNSRQLSQVKYNIWDCDALEALTVITKEYMKHQIKLMQIPTKVNILKCITIYVKSPLNFRTLEEILSLIGSEGFLKRDNQNWGIITRYLKENIQESSALKFISDSCELLESEGEDRIKSLALFIVLLYDSGSPYFKASVSSNSLGKLFSSLADCYKNPDDPLRFLTSLKMIISLMKLSPRANDTYVMTIFGFSEFILNSIWNGSRSRLPKSHKEYLIYVETILAMIKLQNLSPNFTQSITNMMEIEEEEVKRMNDVINSNNIPLLQSSYLLNILYLSNKASDEYSGQEITNETDEKLIQQFHYLIAKICHRRIILSSEKLPEEFYQKFLREKLMILAETQSYDAIPLITKILESIINKLKSYQETIDNCGDIIQDIISICWKNLWNMKRVPEFWTSARHLIKLIWTDSFLKVAKFRSIVLGYVDDIISKSDNTSPLRFILFKQINTMSRENILLFGQAILSSILQTNAAKSHHKRIEMQTCLYIVKTNKIDFSDEILMTGLGIYTDVTTRALLVILILKLGDRRGHREGKELTFTYVPQLISLLEKKKNERYFNASDVHRLKYRIMQVLLLLNLQEDSTKEVHDTLCELLLTENNLPSVRIMQEWILVRIYVENEDMTDLIWNLFPSLRKDQPQSLMSLMSIVYHVAKGLCPKERLVYMKKAMTHILPSCFVDQSEVQFHSQMILLRLFELIDDISLEHLEEYKCLSKAMEENLQSGRVKTRTLEIEDFYFSEFDAFGDFNLQTIFYDVPRLCHMAMDEWIDPNLFDSLLPLYLRVQWFRYHENGGKLVGRASKVLEDADATADSNLLDVSQEEILADVDAEIIPADLMPTNIEMFLPRSRMLRQQLIINDIGLIVIASLIEDFATLGSLARTAEIFYGRELVLESMGCRENKDFQRLSDTAEKWITILEVKRHELRDYLLQKRSMGWKLVGAEQTVNSVNLFDVKFDERTILLLGNEKNGLPANLIQLMDTCVKIPQAGVASPPNVHVTGALCMYQYAQQHLFGSL